MQTQCPHCDTKFRVTETQVQIADGFVRCGVCSEVFNAIDIASQHTPQVSLLGDTSEKAATTIEEDTDLHTDIFPVEALSDDEPEKNTDDFFNEENNESLQHVVPDDFRDTYSSSYPSTLSSILWSIGTLLLISTLIIEYTWFNRDQFNKVPAFQTVISSLCQQITCNNVSIRDPEKIALITRNVFSHPNEKGALMVNVTMKNNAEFAQPYPVLQIDFSDIRGNSVAARRFWPTEYINSKQQPDRTEPSELLQPGTSASITLEIQDPGKQAMTYEFNFL